MKFYEKVVREIQWFEFVEDISINLIGKILENNPEKK